MIYSQNKMIFGTKVSIRKKLIKRMQKKIIPKSIYTIQLMEQKSHSIIFN